MDVRHTLERNVLTQLKRADKYEREERGWDMGHAPSLARSLEGGRHEMKDSLSASVSARPSSVTDCPLENESVPTSHGTWRNRAKG